MDLDRRPRTRITATLLLLVALGASGCLGPPIGVQLMDPRVVHRKLVTSALSGDTPSGFTRAVVSRNGYAEAWAVAPEAALEDMRRALYWEAADEALFALAELSFLHADRTGSREHYLAAALYAYAYVFGDETSETEPPDPFDPRIRLASDIYNRALTSALKEPGGDRVTLRNGAHPLPFGSIHIDFDEQELVWGRYEFTEFVSSADLDVTGLRNRYRRPGLGAPLAAAVAPRVDLSESATRVPPVVRVAMTALLEIEESWAGIRSGEVRATLRLFAANEADRVVLDGRSVPLEVETTSALADTLAVSRFWESETGRFFGTLGVAPDDPWGTGLVMLHPYRRDRIPVVLVHGTASSPGRWAELVNELQGVPLFRDHFQVWLFSYETGQPIGYSAGLLREALERAVTELDPEGRDTNLRRMVVIGHSQGGLLTKLTAVDSGDAFYRVDVPFEELDLTAEQRHVIGRSVFFEPLPFVKRVIFIATPHRGSYLAGWNLANPVSSLVRAPARVTRALAGAVRRNPDAFGGRVVEDIPTSIDNMRPGHWWIEALAALPIADGIEAHSIIAVRGQGPKEEGDDGVVEYASAHHAGVVSERVVRSSHSTQSNPFTIVEVARILISHVSGESLTAIPGAGDESEVEEREGTKP